MEIKQALLQCFSEPSLGLSKTELQQILEDEMNKPEAEMDCEIVDMCVELLSRMDGIAPAEEKTAPVILPAKRASRRPFKVALLVAAIVMLLLASTLFVSAQMKDVRLSEYVVELFSDHIKIEPPKENGKTIAGGDLRAMLADAGFEPVLLPDDFLATATVTQLDYQMTDVSSICNFRAVREKNAIEVSVTKFSCNFENTVGGAQYSGGACNVEEVTVGNVTAVVADLEDYRIAEFADGRLWYSLKTDLDMSAAVELVKSIQ